MFATGSPRYSVRFPKTYLAHRPEEMRKWPSFLVIIEKTKIWSVVRKRGMSVNKIDPCMNKYGLGSGIKCRGKKVTNYSVIKTLVKRLAAWQASVHWKTMREVTKQNNNRYHLSSALLSSNRFGIPVQFSPVCPFSTTIQRLQHAKQSTTFMVASWR